MNKYPRYKGSGLLVQRSGNNRGAVQDKERCCSSKRQFNGTGEYN